MFFKSKTTLKESGLFNGLTDWHCHILPGVDDGFKTMEESLEALRAFEELGVSSVWLTPHIMEDYPNATEALRCRFAELCEAYKGPVKLNLAAENMLDSLFEKRLEARDLLPIGEEGNKLLVETSYYTPPYNLDGILDSIRSAGYFPMLAHPERYRYMEKADYKKLKDKDIYFQVNYMSLVGGYGETARGKAEWLLSEGLVDFTGSDLHRLDALQRALGESAPKKPLKALSSIK